MTSVCAILAFLICGLIVGAFWFLLVTMAGISVRRKDKTGCCILLPTVVMFFLVAGYCMLEAAKELKILLGE